MDTPLDSIYWMITAEASTTIGPYKKTVYYMGSYDFNYNDFKTFFFSSKMLDCNALIEYNNLAILFMRKVPESEYQQNAYN